MAYDKAAAHATKPGSIGAVRYLIAAEGDAGSKV